MREILCFGDSNTYGLIPEQKNDIKKISAGQEYYSRS